MSLTQSLLQALLPRSKFMECNGMVVANLHTMGLRQHQLDALLAILNHFSNHQSVAVVVQPTGSGKSLVAYMAPYVLNVMKVLIITPNPQMTEQMYEDVCGNVTIFEKLGFIDRSSREIFLEKPLKVCKSSDLNGMNNYNYVIANAHKFGAARSNSSVDISSFPRDLFDLIIVDEAQHYPPLTWSGVVNHFTGKKLFLTATPFNRNKSIVDAAQGRICYDMSLDAAVQRRIIRDAAFDEVQVSDIDGVNVRRSTCRRVWTNLLAHDALHPQVKHQALVLVKRTMTADAIARVFNTELGFQAEVAGSFHCRSMNNYRRFLSGELRVLIVCGKLVEGFNRPEVSVVGILRDISSVTLYRQFVGRSYRPCVGEPATLQAKVVSHVKFGQRVHFDDNSVAQ